MGLQLFRQLLRVISNNFVDIARWVLFGDSGVHCSRPKCDSPAKNRLEPHLHIYRSCAQPKALSVAASVVAGRQLEACTEAIAQMMRVLPDHGPSVEVDGRQLRPKANQQGW